MSKGGSQFDNPKIKSHLLPPESFWKMIFARFSFLKFQKESAIGIADLKKNAYNISVAFFRVSEEITKMEGTCKKQDDKE